jgi:hypothetical protein
MSRKRPVPDAPNRLRAAFGSVGKYLLATIVGILLPTYFVRLLPGPKVDAEIQRLNIEKGNAAGCTGYLMQLRSQQPLDNLYFAIEFPGDVANYHVGGGEQFHLPPLGIQMADLIAFGRDANGDCVIKANVEPNDPGFNVWTAGPDIVRGQASKTPPNWTILGFFVLSTKKPSASPAELYGDAAYEYSIFGIAVRKKLTFHVASPQDIR